MTLAKYAIQKTKGREFLEKPPSDRTEFQRDRARIIHSSAFRRLEYKTQVFVNHEGDLYRTRLTHSIEVAQIARSVAQNLQLNTDLTESIALAHDLGHTPFGHAGQEALNQCMKNYGGFEHNFQSLRIVEKLEEHYADFCGLNLCFETKEGILKHCSIPNAQKIGALGERFINQTSSSLEAQVVDISDALAYNNHDIDDGLRSGLLTLKQMLNHDLFADCFNQLKSKYPKTSERIIIHETIRKMIGRQVNDLIIATKINIKNANLSDVKSVKNAKILVNFSQEMLQQHQQLKQLLRHNLYQHPNIVKMTNKAKKTIGGLFGFFIKNPEKLPPMHHSSLDLKNTDKVARACADYISGMTDRFAEKVWSELQ